VIKVKRLRWAKYAAGTEKMKVEKVEY
jgi:hypothetical protein